MKLSQREAAKVWGIGRNRLSDAIQKGKLSLTNDKKIDPSEMVRVFGEPLASKGKGPNQTHQGPAQSPELITLRERVDRLQAELSRADLVIETQKQTIQTLLLLRHQPDNTAEPTKRQDLAETAARKSFWSRLFK
jgi:hypothetical protein